MIEYLATLNYILALGGIALLLGTTVLFVDYRTSRVLVKPIAQYGFWFAFLLTLISMFVALFYSEVLGFIPCGLCWFQRIFLFSQVFILATAIYFKDQGVERYGIVLSIAGAIVGLYQHYLQMGGSEFITCPVAGEGADCSARFMFEFGFMTYPMLSASLFIFLIGFYTYRLKTRD